MSTSSRSRRRRARKTSSSTSRPEKSSERTDTERPALGAIPARRGGRVRGHGEGRTGMRTLCGSLWEDNAMKTRIYAGLLALLVAPAMAAAQAQQPGPPTERTRPVAKISEEQAKKIALERIPGKVTDVTIERK